MRISHSMYKTIIFLFVLLITSNAKSNNNVQNHKWHLIDGSILIGDLVTDAKDHIIIKTEYF